MSKDVLPIHGPDHCPGGPDPIPCLTQPWVILRGAEVESDGSGINVPVRYQYAAKNYDPGNIFNIDQQIDGFRLQVTEEGIYLIDGVFLWESVATGTGTATFSLNPSDCYDEWLDTEDITWSLQVVWGVAANFMRISGIISLAGGVDGGSTVTFNPVANQTTGTTKFGGSIYLKCVRLMSHGPESQWETFLLS